LSVTASPVLDANRDGTGSTTQDEFVELRNVSDVILDLSYFELYDDNNALPVHVFPVGTLLRPGQLIVVFGGGTPGLFPFDVIVQKASSGTLALNNGGDSVYLVDPI